MIKRDEYIRIIEEIRNTEKASLDNYIEEVLMPIINDDKTFAKTLYKDIHYLLKGIDEKGDNDLIIENGTLKVENGEIQLSGYQSRLHNVMMWLNTVVIEEVIKNNPLNVIAKLENFENYFLEKPNYTPEYKYQLDSIKESLRKEREQNLYPNKKKNLFRKIFNIDNLELKPSIWGIGINVDKIIKSLKK